MVSPQKLTWLPYGVKGEPAPSIFTLEMTVGLELKINCSKLFFFFLISSLVLIYPITCREKQIETSSFENIAVLFYLYL